MCQIYSFEKKTFPNKRFVFDNCRHDLFVFNHLPIGLLLYIMLSLGIKLLYVRVFYFGF